MTTSENDRFGELRSALQEPSDEGLEQADALFETLDPEDESDQRLRSYGLDLLEHWDPEWIELLPENLAKAWGARLLPTSRAELKRAIKRCEPDRILEIMRDIAHIHPDIRLFGPELMELDRKAGALIVAADARKLSELIQEIDEQLPNNLRDVYEPDVAEAASLTYQWLGEHARDYNYADADTATWWFAKALEANPHNQEALVMYMQSVFDTDYFCTSLHLGDIAELVQADDPEHALKLSMLDAVANYTVCAPFGDRYTHVWTDGVQYSNDHGATPARWRELLAWFEEQNIGYLPEGLDEGWWERTSQG